MWFPGLVWRFSEATRRKTLSTVRPCNVPKFTGLIMIFILPCKCMYSGMHFPLIFPLLSFKKHFLVESPGRVFWRKHGLGANALAAFQKLFVRNSVLQLNAKYRSQVTLIKLLKKANLTSVFLMHKTPGSFKAHWQCPIEHKGRSAQFPSELPTFPIVCTSHLLRITWTMRI